MEYEIVPYTETDIDAMIEIWNEVVNDGVAFPQLDELNHKTGVEFFGKQDFVGVAKVKARLPVCISSTPTTWADADITPMPAMPFPRKCGA